MFTPEGDCVSVTVDIKTSRGDEVRVSVTLQKHFATHSFNIRRLRSWAFYKLLAQIYNATQKNSDCFRK